MPSHRVNPGIGLPLPANSTTALTIGGDASIFIWDGDSQSFVSLSLSTPSRVDRAWRNGDLGSVEWAEEVEQELSADGKSATLFEVPVKTGSTVDGESFVIVKAETLSEELRAANGPPDPPVPRRRSCDTVIEEDSRVEEGGDKDGQRNPGEGERLPSTETLVLDPLVGTGFGVDDLGYPLHACKTTALFLENAAQDDEVSNPVVVDSDSLDGGYVVVDIAGMCVTPEGVEVGKHRDLLRRWTRAMKRGLNNTSILVNSKGPGKYRISNSNYAKHKAQFHSVVCVTVVQSVETVAR